jgi:hypothetical protein
VIRYLKARYFKANYFTALRLSDSEGSAAGKAKKRKRIGQPWNWMPPLPAVKRSRTKKETELLVFLGSGY